MRGARSPRVVFINPTNTINPMPKKETEHQQALTIEEYIVSQLQTEVKLKDGTMLTDPTDGHVLTKQEAIASSILNLAMKGDIKAAQYINNLQLRMQIQQQQKKK